MQLLESVMAFAVAMIIFSTITTGIVELMLRLSGTREKNLEKTIRALFETVIWPRMKSQLTAALEASGQAGTKGEGDPARKKLLGDRFVLAMMGNPLSSAGADAGHLRSIPARKESQIDSLSILSFAERLGRSDVGKAILVEGEAQLSVLVQDFVRTFDRFARASQEVFRKKAQQTAMVVGIVFALAANVEAGRLFMTLMEDPDLRSSFVEQAEGAAADNKAVTQRLAALNEKLESGGLEKEQLEEISSNIAEISANIRALDATGLPIGYAYFPFCNAGGQGDPDCVVADTSSDSIFTEPLKYLRWLILTIVAGILIGLGGPFWFRVFSSLSQVVQMLRSFGAGSGTKSKKFNAAAEPASRPEDSAKPKDVIDAFVVAAKVHAESAAST